MKTFGLLLKNTKQVNKRLYSSLSKPMIGVDVDEVLCPFVVQLCKFHNEYYNSELRPDHFFSYVFREIPEYGAKDEPQSKEILTQFFQSKYFADMPVILNAYDTLHGMKEDFNFSVITSRRNELETMTREWIDEYFPDIFDEQLFGNHFNDGASLTKTEMCQQINARIAIDDNLKYCQELSKSLDLVILYGDYPWNKMDNLPDNVIRCNDWFDIKATLSQYKLSN